ncbi:ABC-2 type transport system ATP-binding protein [Kibdelosporangium banguiense]|uniref:ABC-2 type transport system ATP-binding protein n=1 Tax=Kibdelosporangium banguiense TaxID=1365924 RepID=A0ABS4TUP9_9PSEU|nr:ATP-binding cassette domain-containing protein [Kibdelosporangium banguiense]MBP2328112.1 ABC-2 type transport system ATP-binding protein [Kibdelosporangium banguiense]
MIVAFEDVSYSYRRKPALTNLNWTVSEGITGLVGPNGAGKSTMLALLVGLRKPKSGRVTVGGTGSGTRRRVGYLPQRFSLVPSMTVRNTVVYAAWLNGLDRRAAEAAADRALELVDLSDRADSAVRTLSGGLRQRAGIAAAVAHEPEIVVLDEPTVGLDPGQRVRIRRVIERIGMNHTVVLSTHLVEDVVNLCPTVSVLDAGSLRFHGPLTELVDGAEVSATNLEQAYERLLGQEDT